MAMMTALSTEQKSPQDDARLILYMTTIIKSDPLHNENPSPFFYNKIVSLSISLRIFFTRNVDIRTETLLRSSIILYYRKKISTF